ncbi:MAG: molybdopterin-dependent oxidoreductase, partial [Deferribacterales bacterium]|nr:molybdopterin-dependent oxidoreductase [Deferribacterales bacterium]
IDATSAHAGTRVVAAVPAGRSYCSWILGSNNSAKTYSALGAASNYTASQFAAGSDMKRWAPCSYEVKQVAGGTGSKYLTKQDYQTPKTPAWASAITGIPEESIKKLAEVYAKGGPITSTWSGGQQKQADGIANLFALQSLHVITKNVGTKGAAVIWHITPSVIKDSGALDVKVPHPNVNNYPNMKKAEASCTAWHTVIKMAYAEELKGNGYNAKHIPNFTKGTDTTPNVYWDDGGTKTFIKWKRDPNTGAIEETTPDANGNTFFKWVGYDEGLSPVVSGIRLMYNTGGNIFINQHENSNDSRQMLECLNLDDGSADTFCLVSFDNFMSPSVRWSDYVLPAATSWEQQDIMAPTNGTNFYIPQVITPPGESKPTWDFANELLKTYEKIDPSAAGAATDFTGGVPNKPVEGFVKDAFRVANANPASPFYGMSWDEFIEKPFLPAKPDDDTIPVPAAMAFMNNYATADKTAPFVKPNVAGYFRETHEVSTGGYGNEYCNLSTAPASPRRFQVYSPVLVWQYENRFSKWHGYLPEAQRGQPHKDLEGDRYVIEIPVYYAYQDYFMEAYGLADTDTVNREYPFTLTTTHDRYRSHSSMAENPMLRELTHRVPGRDAKGNYKQA